MFKLRITTWVSISIFILLLILVFRLVPDFTHGKTITDYRIGYCNNLNDSKVEKAIIETIREEIPLYPEDGVCTGLSKEGENK